MITTVEERAAELHDVIRTCTLCALSATRTHAVPGEGPLTAEVMCIGEAPGMNEDKQGRPFVGAAGQFLGELLGAAGLTREQVYICNVLKCRPPGNRDPLPNEIDACAEYLDLQIDLVDPLVIVTPGALPVTFSRKARIRRRSPPSLPACSRPRSSRLCRAESSLSVIASTRFSAIPTAVSAAACSALSARRSASYP